MKNELIISGVQSKNQVSSSLHSLFSEYDQEKSKISQIAKFVTDKSSAIDYFVKGNEATLSYAKTLFEPEGALKALDADFWSKAIRLTDVRDCMPAKQKNEWDQMISDLKTPAFDKETVVTTLHTLLLSRDKFLAQKVDGIFGRLSNTHVTNSPFAFRERLIMDYIITGIGKYPMLSSERVEYINDFRSVVAKLMKRDQESRISVNSQLNQIMRDDTYGKWFDFDGGAFKLKLFKKGTVHIEIHEDIALQLNDILSILYPSVIATGKFSRPKSKSSELNPIELKVDLISFKSCAILAEISDSVEKGRSFSLTYYSIEQKSTEDEVIKVLEYLGGKSDKNLWRFNYDASGAIRTVARTGCLPEQQSHQFYPTELTLAQQVVELADIDQYDSVLEPSAGLGGIANLLPKKQTTCIEISPVHGEVLKSQGFRAVIIQDFLKYKPDQKFDKIVMNPPFTKGQAEKHLKHAESLLAKDGKVVAILPASLKGKTLITGRTHEWSEVIVGAFEGTQVSVVILELA